MPRRRAVLRLMLSAEEHLFEPGKLVPELHRLLRPEASEVLQLPLHRRKPGRIDRQVELRPVGLAREERPQEGSSSTFARTLLDVGDSLSRPDRKSYVAGKSGSVRVNLGGVRCSKKKT